jgi:hypothetical protein
MKVWGVGRGCVTSSREREEGEELEVSADNFSAAAERRQQRARLH